MTYAVLLSKFHMVCLNMIVYNFITLNVLTKKRCNICDVFSQIRSHNYEALKATDLNYIIYINIKA